MLPQWIIEKKRDGHKLSKEEIDWFIQGYTREDIPDYQMAALAMAIYFQGMTLDEAAHLTESMMCSGRIVDTSSIPLPKIDKHSTGGVGDKVSIILAPLVACCGVAVPMISGRGLGITGGTLDKLESIPGFNVNLSEAEFLATLKKCGVSMIGQTKDIAPADKKLYGLRDVTATVPSIPLIVGSIMCKKLAEGIDGLVLDVKVGAGAFMKTLPDAKKLAEWLVQVGQRMGKKVSAILTAMDEPLGLAAGNSLEIIESVEALRGRGPKDLMEVTYELCGEMLVLAGVAKTRAAAIEILQEKIANGEALAKFAELVRLHGGDPAFIDDYSRLPGAKIKQALKAQSSGFVSTVNAEAIGRACILLGGGRQKVTDIIDHGVGISSIKKVGDKVEQGDTLCVLEANSQDKLLAAQELAQGAFSIDSVKPARKPLIIDNYK